MHPHRILLVSLTVLVLSPVSASWAQNQRDPNRDTLYAACQDEIAKLAGPSRFPDPTRRCLCSRVSPR